MIIRLNYLPAKLLFFSDNDMWKCNKIGYKMLTATFYPLFVNKKSRDSYGFL